MYLRVLKRIFYKYKIEIGIELFLIFSPNVTVHGKTNVNDLAKRSLNSFVHRSLVVRNYLPFVNKFE